MLNVAPGKVKCPRCGSVGIEVEDNPTDESVVSCPTCKSELTTWGELRAAARKKARAHFRSSFRIKR